jgi:GGDEF domain-containing protein
LFKNLTFLFDKKQERHAMALVSLKRSLSELDRAEERAKALFALQGSVFDTLRQRTLEIDVAAANDVRSLMRSLWGDLGAHADGAELERVRTEFENGWTVYHSRSSHAFRQIQAELAETVRVLRETLGGLERDSDDSPEDRMERSVESLKELSRLNDLNAIRSGLIRSADSLAACVEDLRRERTVLVTQLRDEIRTLQNHLDRAKRSAAVDHVTGLANRQEMERLIASSIQSGTIFSLVYVWLRNFKQLERELSRPMADRLVCMLSSETVGRMPENSTLGRWSDDEFCALVVGDKPPALRLTRELSAHLNNHFVVHSGSVSRTVTIRAHVGVVESHSDEEPARFFHRSDKLIKAIQGTA